MFALFYHITRYVVLDILDIIGFYQFLRHPRSGRAVIPKFAMSNLGMAIQRGMPSPYTAQGEFERISYLLLFVMSEMSGYFWIKIV